MIVNSQNGFVAYDPVCWFRSPLPSCDATFILQKTGSSPRAVPSTAETIKNSVNTWAVSRTWDLQCGERYDILEYILFNALAAPFHPRNVATTYDYSCRSVCTCPCHQVVSTFHSISDFANVEFRNSAPNCRRLTYFIVP